MYAYIRKQIDSATRVIYNIFENYQI